MKLGQVVRLKHDPECNVPAGSYGVVVHILDKPEETRIGVQWHDFHSGHGCIDDDGEDLCPDGSGWYVPEEELELVEFQEGGRVRVVEEHPNNAGDSPPVWATGTLVQVTASCVTVEFDQTFAGGTSRWYFPTNKFRCLVPLDQEKDMEMQGVVASAGGIPGHIGELLTALLQAQVAEPAKDVEVVRDRELKRIILPEGMSLKEGADWLLKKDADEEKEVEICYELDCFPLDGAVAFYEALQELHGFVQKVDTKVETMFGVKLIPPKMIAVPVSADGVKQVPWGRLKIPGIYGYFDTKVKVKDSRGNIDGTKFVIAGKIKQRHAAEVEKLVAHAKQRLQEFSIYKGKAVELDLSWMRGEEEFDPVANAPKFTIPLAGVDESYLILPAEAATAVKVGLFTVIDNHRFCRRMGIPARRGVLLSGPPGCLHPETQIYDPVDGSILTVRDRCGVGSPFHVWSLTKTGEVVIAKAESPKAYHKAKMVKISLASGITMTVTPAHRIWSGGQYMTVQSLLESDASHLPTISGNVLLARQRDALLLTQTPPGSPGRCLEDFYPCDEQPLSGEEADQAASQLQVDAQPHSHALSRQGDLGERYSGSDPASSHLQPSTGSIALAEPLTENGSSPLAPSESPERGYYSTQFVEIPQTGAGPDHTDQRPDGFSDRSMSGASSLQSPCIIRDSAMYFEGDEIVKVEDVGEDVYYDFHVPVHENYWACGMFHHNTGKTLTAWITAAKAVAQGMTFIYLRHVQDLAEAFEIARLYQPAVVFAEDLDVALTSMEDEEVEQIRNAFDGVNTKNDAIITVLTTNFIEKIADVSQAILRQGRCDLLVDFPLPDAAAAAQLVELYGRGLLEEGFDYQQAGRSLQGHIPAEIREAVERSKMTCIERLCRTGNINEDQATVAGQIKAGDVIQAVKAMERQHELLKPKDRVEKDATVRAAQITAQSTLEAAKVLAGRHFHDSELEFLGEPLGHALHDHALHDHE